MKVTQQIHHINENSYDEIITITDIPKGYFPAVTDNTYNWAGTREITVAIIALESSEGGTMEINSGLYIRQDGETAVKVTVNEDGKEVATNTANYD